MKKFAFIFVISALFLSACAEQVDQSGNLLQENEELEKKVTQLEDKLNDSSSNELKNEEKKSVMQDFDSDSLVGKKWQLVKSGKGEQRFVTNQEINFEPKGIDYLVIEFLEEDGENIAIRYEIPDTEGLVGSWGVEKTEYGQDLTVVMNSGETFEYRIDSLSENELVLTVLYYDDLMDNISVVEGIKNDNEAEWNTLIGRISEDISENETITSFNMPTGIDPNIIYFSTSSDIESIDGVSLAENSYMVTNKIYSFDIRSNELMEEIYEERDDRLLRLIGRQGNNLVLMKDFPDNSPGPCTSIWLDFDLISYNLNDGTTSEYQIPEEWKNIQEIEEMKCVESLGL